jgi:hypothetical protein
LIRKTLFLSLLLSLLMGCQTISERKQANALQDVLRNYEAVIRWGSLDQARQFLPQDKQSDAAVQAPRDLRVTHYEVVQGPSMLGSDRAMQTAVVQYVFEESQVVRELVDRQTWELDPESQSWHLVSPLPEFK